jgi:hypothetical protein
MRRVVVVSVWDVEVKFCSKFGSNAWVATGDIDL